MRELPFWLPCGTFAKCFVAAHNENAQSTLRDASIDESERAQIESYLVQNASERSNYKRSVKITRSLQQGTLYTSLTQIPYLQKKHRKIDKNLINQKEVRSLARCAACHKDAEKGEFSKRTVYIPNYGAWRD